MAVSVTRLGDLLDFRQLFKAFGDNCYTLRHIATTTLRHIAIPTLRHILYLHYVTFFTKRHIAIPTLRHIFTPYVTLLYLHYVTLSYITSKCFTFHQTAVYITTSR